LSHSASEDEPEISKPGRDDKSAQILEKPTANGTSRQKAKTKDDAATTANTLPTGGITKSSILALQLTDLNTELTPNYEKLRVKWTTVTKRLRTLIENIPARAPITAVDAMKSFRKQGVKIQ
jgi:hypothetical protein